MAKISGGAVIGWKVSSKCKIAKQISFFLCDVIQGPYFWVAQYDFLESVTANALVCVYGMTKKNGKGTAFCPKGYSMAFLKLQYFGLMDDT